MDPLSCLAVAGTVVQFVDFSSKLISASHELYRDQSLEVHEQIARSTNDILDYSVKLQRSLRLTNGSATLSGDDLLLESICRGCDELVHDLLARLEKLKVTRNQKEHKLWKTLTVVFQSIWTKEDLFVILEKLK